MSIQQNEISASFLQIDLLSACLCVAVVLFIFAAARITPKFVNRDTEPIREVTFEFTPALPEDVSVAVGASLSVHPSNNSIPIKVNAPSVEPIDGIKSLFRSLSTKDKDASLVSFVVSHDDSEWPITFTVTIDHDSAQSFGSFAWSCSSSPGSSTSAKGYLTAPTASRDNFLRVSVTAQLEELTVNGTSSTIVVMSNIDNSHRLDAAAER